MSACESMVGLILASVEGTLDPSSRAHLEAHAASCAGCRRALDEQAAVKRMLADLPAVTVSRGFAARVRERVEARPWWMPAGNWRLWTLRLAPIAALLTFLAWLPLQSDATGSVTTTTPVSLRESWATAALSGGASGSSEYDSSLPQLLDPSVHAHTLLAPSAAETTPTSTTGSGGSAR
jgi:anti-sigma factor RsiW